MRHFIIITLLSCTTFAETDTFNMSLNGNFSQDYCTIQLVNPSPSITLDMSVAQKTGSPSRGITYYFYDVLPNTHASINCSPGEYKVYLQSRDNLHTYGVLNDSYAREYSRHYINNILHSDYSTYHQSDSDYYSTTPSAIRATYGEVARYEFYFDFVLKEDDINLLGDTFSFSTTFNFIIDKL